MAQFAFEAVDVKGKSVKGQIEAKTADEARSKIQSKSLFVTNLKTAAGPATATSRGPGAAAPASASAAAAPRSARPATVGPGGAPRSSSAAMAPRSAAAAPAKAAPPAAPATAQVKLRKAGGSVSQKILTQFTQQFSTLIDAGLPIVRSLKILEGQLKPGPMKICAGQLAEAVESGASLSEAMAQHPKIFDKLYVNMVRAGEAGGVLEVIFRRLAEFMEKSQRIKAKVKGAMVYPAVVLTIAGLILTGILIFVIPKFEAMFVEMGLSLPAITSLLIQVSRAMVKVWFLIVALPFVLIFGFRMAMKNESIAYNIDSFKLRMPLIGGIIKKSIISRFCRTLGTLITSGVAILESLNILKNAIGNRVVSKAIEKVHSSIREGESIAAPLGESGIFDDIVVNMIDVGEETGELDKMLVKVADNYDEEVDIAVESLTSLLEPIMIVFMGGAVGTIVIALFMPLIGLIDGIGGNAN